MTHSSLQEAVAHRSTAIEFFFGALPLRAEIELEKSNCKSSERMILAG